MRYRIMKRKALILTVVVVALFSAYKIQEFRSAEVSASTLSKLLPELDNWTISEDLQIYYPENLFEYINGAAEIYLAYEFKELMVAQFDQKNSDANITVEIYNMGGQKNSFGIYSAERYPDNQFIPVGIQGYTEEGLLNFLIGDYYIKLFCFGCSGENADALLEFSKKIEAKVAEKGKMPPLLEVFPQNGKIENSERFILKNFLGYGFLHDGLLVNYNADSLEFECFLIEGRDEEDAKQMWRQFIKAKNEVPQESSMGKMIMIKDRYYKNIFLIMIDKYICGVMKIEDGSESVGKEYLETMAENLKNHI
jgi:hypothetical protein